MGKRSAVVELFLGDMGSMQRELRPSTQREDQLTMETKLEQIAVKAVNQLPKSVVREIRTPRSVGAGGGRPPPATRWARRNPRPYRDHGRAARRSGLKNICLSDMSGSGLNRKGRPTSGLLLWGLRMLGEPIPFRESVSALFGSAKPFVAAELELSEIGPFACRVSFAPKATIFTESEPAIAIYVLTRGTACLYKMLGDGR